MKSTACPVRSLLTRFLSLACSAGPLVLGQANPRPVLPLDESTISLPEFTVTDSRILPEPERWFYARAGGFEVLSEGSRRTTESLLRDFQLFTAATRLVWSAPPRPLAAKYLILCQRPGRFAQFRSADGPEQGQIEASQLMRNREQAVIVVDLDADRITLDASAASTEAAGVEYQVDHYRQLYREYARFMISQSASKVPVWLEEGLAQIVMDVQLGSRTLVLGKIETYRGAESGGATGPSDDNDATADATAVVGERPFNVVFRTRSLMPFERFFAVTADSPEAASRLGNNRWAKQAYAFVHFCLFGENLRHKEALSQFVARLAKEPLSEQLFRDCFKIGYADMAKQLRSYILHVAHKYQKYDLERGEIAGNGPIEIRDAAPAQIGLIKGDALRLAGRMRAADAEYRIAYLRGARDPELLASLGLAEAFSGNGDRAAELLDAAMAAGATKPSAYIERARLQLGDALAAPNARLTQAQAAAVLARLHQARQMPPLLPEGLQLMAEVWLAQDPPPTRAEIAILDDGVKAFPRESTLVLAAAQLNQRCGAPEVAAAIAKLGLRFTSDPANRAAFEALVAPAAASR